MRIVNDGDCDVLVSCVPFAPDKFIIRAYEDRIFMGGGVPEGFVLHVSAKAPPVDETVWMRRPDPDVCPECGCRKPEWGCHCENDD